MIRNINIDLKDLIAHMGKRMNAPKEALNGDKVKGEIFTRITEYEQDLKTLATQGKEEAREFTRNRIGFMLSEMKEIINLENIDEIIKQYHVNYFSNVYSGEGRLGMKPIDREISQYFQRFSINLHDGFERKLQKLAQICYQELYGYSILDELIFEGGLNEVACNRQDFIWIQYKGIKRRIPNPAFKFKSCEDYEKIIENRLVSTAREEMNGGEPIIYSTLLNGFRVTAARPPLSRFFTVSIRCFPKPDRQHGNNRFFGIGPEPEDQGKTGSGKIHTEKSEEEDNKIARVLNILIKRGRRNIGVIGEQGAGKTTAADELIIRNLDDDISIGLAENIHELNISEKYKNKNVIEFQYGRDFEPARIIEMFFRFNRDIIILGEIRSHLEAFEMIKAMMRQARGSLFTFHSSSIQRMIHDLRQLLMQTGFYTDYREAQFDIADAIDLALHVKLDRDTGRRYIYKVSEIIAKEEAMSYEIRNLFVYERESGKYLINRAGLSGEIIESCLEYELRQGDVEELKELFSIEEGEEASYGYI